MLVWRLNRDLKLIFKKIHNLLWVSAFPWLLALLWEKWAWWFCLAVWKWLLGKNYIWNDAYSKSPRWRLQKFKSWCSSKALHQKSSNRLFQIFHKAKKHYQSNRNFPRVFQIFFPFFFITTQQSFLVNTKN